MENKFKVVSKYKPTGDQPQAIEKIAEGFQKGLKFQTLLGVTGSGKTFTMANIIEKIQKPTLVIAHNKTLAAQLYNELKEFFPENAVEYFVSYYDYYQPEAYVPSTDTYIERIPLSMMKLISCAIPPRRRWWSERMLLLLPAFLVFMAWVTLRNTTA